jgi:2-oxoisovalerate dehydrogenase E2 component (dihydrolipoyl transacylase)
MGLTALKMPQLGESVTEGTVDHWLKKEGEMVRHDEPIVEVVTDKVNAAIPSPFEGRLVRIQVQEGQTVPIGSVLAELEIEGGDEEAARGAPEVRPAAASEGGASPPIAQPAVEEPAGSARDLPQAEVPAAPPAPPVPAGPVAAPGPREELVRISAVRRQIAEHMVRSVTTSPHAWSLREVDMSRLVEYREAQRDEFQARHGFPLSYVAFFIQVVCAALKENPHLNSTWTDQGILLKHYINMGIAVALPDVLIVPVIKDADQKGFTDLAWAVNDLAGRARNRSLRPEDVQGGTFTLNNTGPLGSVAGQSIINQPQAAILSTEAIRKRAVVVDDTIAIRPMMNLTMSFDHRIVDGLAASQFLDAVQSGIERWTPASIRI